MLASLDRFAASHPGVTNPVAVILMNIPSEGIGGTLSGYTPKLRIIQL